MGGDEVIETIDLDSITPSDIDQGNEEALAAGRESDMDEGMMLDDG
jgi:hypothetical protein